VTCPFEQKILCRKLSTGVYMHNLLSSELHLSPAECRKMSTVPNMGGYTFLGVVTMDYYDTYCLRDFSSKRVCHARSKKQHLKSTHALKRFGVLENVTFFGKLSSDLHKSWECTSLKVFGTRDIVLVATCVYTTGVIRHLLSSLGEKFLLHICNIHIWS
jgi:hypothetical protein